VAAKSDQPTKKPAAEPSKSRRAARKPLLDVAVDQVKKMLKPKSRSVVKVAPEETPQAAPPAKSAEPLNVQDTVTPEIIAPAAVAKKSTAKKAASKHSATKPIVTPVTLAVPAESKAAQAETETETTFHRSAPRKKKIEPPAILLEGDEPSLPPVSGPGEKFSLGATAPVQKFNGGELPESYGTKKLFLTARDPHWLYANWDLTTEQQKELNAQSTDGHLILRVYAGKVEGHPAYEIHVHPESRHWFAHVERAGNSYAAELGYYSDLGKWIRVAVSSGTLTPPEAVSEESDTEFATIPFEYPFSKLVQIIEEAVRDNQPLAVAIEDLRRHGHPDLPRFSSSGASAVPLTPSAATGQIGPSRVWTPEQEQALARIINIDQTRRVWMGSLEITELIRRRLAQEITSPVTAFGPAAGQAPGGAPGSPGVLSVTSPAGGMAEAAAKSFWFNVNAELIIYGATEPNAKVTLGGHEIKLRSDGTFSFRFALPDGKYDLPAVAISADGTDGRAAELRFSRETQYLGDVGATPQDPALQPPLADTL
ncbi:MAG TPA: DUF4912 domain-containing protein, partial [Verrucomicrobiae bacterium]